MATASMGPGQVVYPDGRLDLVDDRTIQGSPLYNPDLAPVPVARRTWTTYNYLALWVGMAHNIASYLLASGLIALGMNWIQAIITIALGNIIVLVPMLLNSHAGTKYGIPFPVFARAAYGTYGANFPALLRALIACGWFGIQTWIGGQIVYTSIGALAGGGWLHSAAIGGQPWTLWVSFFVFWLFNILIIARGMDTLRRFENWAAPAVLVVALVLLAWILVQAKGFGPIVSQPSKLGWGPNFWHLFFPSLMGIIAFWSTMSLNMPDFTRFGQSQRAQLVGQIAGLPTTMTVFSVLAVLITSGTAVVFGKPIWDPVALVGAFHNPLAIVIALFTLAVATLSANVAANVVSPSNDFSNALPKLINFRTGGLITGIIGILLQPWRLLGDPHVYVFAWLGFYGGALGAIAGVLIADYWIVRRTRLNVADLYRAAGIYRYTGGWNWRAVVATLVGIVLAAGGAYSAPAGSGPFPVNGLIPILKPLYDYSWVVGFVAALVVYAALALALPASRGSTDPADRGVEAPTAALAK